MTVIQKQLTEFLNSEDPSINLLMEEILHHLGVSQNWGYLFGGSHNKDYSILGLILGSPI